MKRYSIILTRYYRDADIIRWRHEYSRALLSMVDEPELKDSLEKKNYCVYNVPNTRTFFVIFTEEHPYYNLGLFDQMMRDKNLYSFFDSEHDHFTSLIKDIIAAELIK